VITLIHGPAELLRAEALSAVRAGIADDPALADLNTTRLDGRQAPIVDLQNACDTLPFLAARRLVVVDGLLRQLATPARSRAKAEASSDEEEAEAEAPQAPESSKGQGKALLDYLDRVPETTELVFVEDDVLRGGTLLRRIMELQRDQRAAIIVCQTPRKSDLPGWIRARARQRGANLDAGALADLAEFVGDDLRQLDQELIKLVDYTAGKRTVTRDDVRRLVPATRAANIFALVDALGLGDANTAGRLLQHALDVDGEPPLRLLGMIARQYRLLIQAKALQAQGRRPPEIAKELGVPDWTAPKLLTQAGRHSFTRLESAMERILAADEGIKTGKISDREAMDVLLAELVGG